MSAGKRRNFPTTRFNAKKKIHSKKKKKKKKVVSFPFHTKKNTIKWISIGDDDSRDDNDERERRRSFVGPPQRRERRTIPGSFSMLLRLSLSLSLSHSFGFNFFFFCAGEYKMWEDSFFCLFSSSNISLKSFESAFKKKYI